MSPFASGDKIAMGDYSNDAAINTTLDLHILLTRTVLVMA